MQQLFDALKAEYVLAKKFAPKGKTNAELMDALALERLLNRGEIPVVNFLSTKKAGLLDRSPAFVMRPSEELSLQLIDFLQELVADGYRPRGGLEGALRGD